MREWFSRLIQFCMVYNTVVMLCLWWFHPLGFASHFWNNSFLPLFLFFRWMFPEIVNYSSLGVEEDWKLVNLSRLERTTCHKVWRRKCFSRLILNLWKLMLARIEIFKGYVVYFSSHLIQSLISLLNRLLLELLTLPIPKDSPKSYDVIHVNQKMLWMVFSVKGCERNLTVILWYVFIHQYYYYFLIYALLWKYGATLSRPPNPSPINHIIFMNCTLQTEEMSQWKLMMKRGSFTCCWNPLLN